MLQLVNSDTRPSAPKRNSVRRPRPKRNNAEGAVKARVTASPSRLTPLSICSHPNGMISLDSVKSGRSVTISGTSTDTGACA